MKQAEERHERAMRESHDAFGELISAFRDHVQNLRETSDGFYSSLGDKKSDA